MTSSPPSMPPSPADPASKRLAVLLTIGGAVGLLAAAVLLIDKVRLLEDPTYVPSCSINPILSCGSVLNTDQAEAFGFPNPIIGVAGFAVVLTTGVAMLAGSAFRRWYWLGLQAGATFGVVFVHWLIFQSLYRIGALCPYCMVVWVVTIPVFLFVTVHNVRAGRLPAGRSRRFIGEYPGAILTSWYLVIAALIAKRFWDYWQTLLP